MGNGFFAAKRQHRHFQAVVRVAADLGFDFAVKRHNAVGHGAVHPLYRARLQLLHQLGLRRQGFGHHHQAAGVFIQPMHDARPRHLRQGRAMVQQAVKQSTLPIARRRMHHHARRFVHHQHAVVFVNNIQIHRLGGKGLVFLGGHNGDLQHFAAHQLVFGLCVLAVEQHGAVFNPAGKAAARIIGQQFGQCRIQPQTGQFIGHG